MDTLTFQITDIQSDDISFERGNGKEKRYIIGYYMG